MVLAKVSSHGTSEKLSNCVLVNGRDNRISQVFGEREQKRLKCDSGKHGWGGKPRAYFRHVNIENN